MIIILDRYGKPIPADHCERTCCTYHRNAGRLRPCMPEVPDDDGALLRAFYDAYLPALLAEQRTEDGP